MDDIQQILIVVAALIVIIVVFWLFKDRITGIKISNSLGEFNIQLGPIRNKLEQHGIHVDSVGNERSDIPERDAVISSFAVLNEVIFSLARNKNLKIPPHYTTLNVLNVLIAEKILPVEWAESIRDLYNYGKQVMDQPNAKLPENYGKNYHALVSSLVFYIRNERPGSGSTDPEPGKPEEVLKRTQIGSPGFSAPKLEKPSAVLYATAGSVQGRRFPVDKSTFHIGANSRNDLVIPDDSFVSGNHAYIRYDNGNLNLFDDQSTNGTFLNNQRLATQSLSLRIGDQIKIGGCTFTVE